MAEQAVNFDLLDLAIPETVLLYTIEVQQDIFDYIQQMNDENKGLTFSSLVNYDWNNNIFLRK